MGAGRMVRLRTFHGYSEWNGKWSDGDSSWTNQLRQLMNFDNNSDDGTFWMSFDDFLSWFNVIFTCRMADDRWTKLTTKSQWADTTAGGCCPNYGTWRTNPQWLLKTSQYLRLTVSLSIPQPGASSEDMAAIFPPEAAMGISVLRGNEGADSKRRKLLLSSSEELIVRAEPRPVRRLVQEISLEPSETPYILMAHTFMPGREAPFNLVVRCDDENDDGIPDFTLEPVRAESDWVSKQVTGRWIDSLSGSGAPADDGDEEQQPTLDPTAGGPPGSAGFGANPNIELHAQKGGRFYVFVDQLGLEQDGRTHEGMDEDGGFPAVGVALSAGSALADGKVEEGELLQSEEAHPMDSVVFACTLEPSDAPYVILPFLADPAAALSRHPNLRYRVWVYSDSAFDLGAPHECGGPSCEYNCTDCPMFEMYERLKKMEVGLDKQLKYLGGLSAFATPQIEDMLQR